LKIRSTAFQREKEKLRGPASRESPGKDCLNGQRALAVSYAIPARGLPEPSDAYAAFDLGFGSLDGCHRA
jgi:hypothetical protein